jgi:hypothetical protein
MGNLIRLAVICIDFGDRAHVAISEVISPTSIRHPNINLFINPRVMGFCTTSSVVWWTMNAKTLYRPTQVPSYKPALKICSPG